VTDPALALTKRTPAQHTPTVQIILRHAELILQNLLLFFLPIRGHADLELLVEGLDGLSWLVWLLTMS
jgi:hypothetical protein